MILVSHLVFTIIILEDLDDIWVLFLDIFLIFLLDMLDDK